MRALAGIAILALLTLLALFLCRSGGSTSALPPPLAPAQTETARASTEASSVKAESIDGGAPAPVDSRRLAAEATASAPHAACEVLGQVVDENDAALVGVKVRLAAYQGWADGQEVPRLSGRVDLRGWETNTDEQGSFRFAVPLPTVTTVQFQVLPDDFHDSVREFLGGTDARFRAALHLGKNDLGLFRLAATGALRGRVTDGNGRPLEYARLAVGTERSTTIGREADSDAAGNYVIGHVKQGTYGVGAKCEGFLSEFRKPVEVRTGQVTSPVDYVLLPAPALGGVVVDEGGRGLEGARLWSWPSTSGEGAWGKSSADGSFAYFLPQNEPYTLEVTLDGYDSFGVGDRTTHYAQNSRDLRVVLKKSEAAKTRFVVVDGTSGANIEQFGLEIERDRGSRAERNDFSSYRPRPRPVAHPGGEVEVFARPGLDLYTVIAPGYMRKSGDVEHASKDSSVQTVKLALGGGLLGRAMVGAAPTAGITLRLETGSMQVDESLSPIFKARNDDVQQLSTGVDGRFRFDSLDPGSYRLTLRAPGRESLEVVPVRIRMNGDTDLGDLVLQHGATIVARILVPERRKQQGLVVSLDGRRSPIKQTTDAEGYVRFEGLTAGHHSLTLDDVPGVLAGGAAAEVDVCTGEMKEVVIDARACGTCNVVLTIEIPGQSIEGLQVYLVSTADLANPLVLGRTDAKGVVTGSVRAAGNARVQVFLPRGSVLRHPSAQVPLVLDRNVESTVRFEVGSVRFEIPSSLQLPTRGAATLDFADDAKDFSTPLPLSAPIGEMRDRSRGMELEADGRHFLARVVLAGKFDGEFLMQALEPEAEEREVYRSTIHVAVHAGQTSEVRLP